MSKFVTSQLAIGSPGPMNLDEVVTFEKYEHLSVPEHRDGTSKGRYQIKFYRNERAIGENTVTWKYATECNRNADYDKLIEQNTQTL